MDFTRVSFLACLAFFFSLGAIALSIPGPDNSKLYAMYFFLLHPNFILLFLFLGPQLFLLIPLVLVLLICRFRVGAMAVAVWACLNAGILALPPGSISEMCVCFGPTVATHLLFVAMLFLTIACAIEPVVRLKARLDSRLIGGGKLT